MIVIGCQAETTVVIEMYPQLPEVDTTVPGRPREYLRQAQEGLGQPAASVMMSASAVDAMLKEKGLKEGSLFKRIAQAAANNLITPNMADWAHQIRLDANDQRHADEEAPLPEVEDAKLCLDFALALADVLFVLPARVTHGLAASSP